MNGLCCCKVCIRTSLFPVLIVWDFGVVCLEIQWSLCKRALLLSTGLSSSAWLVWASACAGYCAKSPGTTLYGNCLGILLDQRLVQD